jgi:hypothetical protein
MGSRSRGLLVHAELLLNTLGSGPTSVVQAAQDGPRQHPATGSDAAGQGTLQPEAAMWSVAIAGHSAVSGKRAAAGPTPSGVGLLPSLEPRSMECDARSPWPAKSK